MAGLVLIVGKTSDMRGQGARSKIGIQKKPVEGHGAMCFLEAPAKDVDEAPSENCPLKTEWLAWGSRH